MDVLMSNWSNVVQSLPEKYIFPPHKRPGKHEFPLMNNLPVIDLSGKNRAFTVQRIFDASQEFGFFQVINHGVPVTLMNETMNAFQEFFKLPPEYKSTFYSTDTSEKCRIYSSTLNYDNEDFHYWRDNFTHHCHVGQFWWMFKHGYLDNEGCSNMEVLTMEVTYHLPPPLVKEWCLPPIFLYSL
ncbi:hypothetical protein ACS0TY_005757 [Phlomoides rotata]